MQHILFILFCAFLAALPASAKSETLQFDEMSLAELSLVDTQALNKAERKLHKKAMKAAKKAERKRKKAVRKGLKLSDKIYKKTDIDTHPANGEVRIAGPYHTNEFSLFGAGDPTVSNRYWLQAHILPDKSDIVIHAYVSSRVVTTELTQSKRNHIYLTPVEWARVNRVFGEYRQAVLLNGTALQAHTFKQYLTGCDAYSCEFREVTYVPISLDIIKQTFGASEHLSFRLRGLNMYGDHNISFYYILGFVKRLAEADPQLASVRIAIQGLEESLADQSN
ncbi:MAG: hypothetical protein HWE25_11095 [Alphaproteobacteria bacterium]|nr:hypothetical protein [Alphaproteobacteria bacterium]